MKMGVAAAQDHSQRIDRTDLFVQRRERAPQVERGRRATIGTHDEEGVNSSGHVLVSLGVRVRDLC
ncbi:hypothetical protein GCM10025773_37550 [Microbacterium jejuense]